MALLLERLDTEVRLVPVRFIGGGRLEFAGSFLIDSRRIADWRHMVHEELERGRLLAEVRLDDDDVCASLRARLGEAVVVEPDAADDWQYEVEPDQHFERVIPREHDLGHAGSVAAVVFAHQDAGRPLHELLHVAELFPELERQERGDSGEQEHECSCQNGIQGHENLEGGGWLLLHERAAGERLREDFVMLFALGLPRVADEAELESITVDGSAEVGDRHSDIPTAAAFDDENVRWR